MRSTPNALRSLSAVLLLGACLGTVWSLAAANPSDAQARPDAMQGRPGDGAHHAHGKHSGGQGMHDGGAEHGGGHGKHGSGGKHAGRGAKHGGGRAEHGGGHGKHRGGPMLHGPSWKETLTEGQKSQLDRLHAELARTKAPAKARIQAAKVELAVLATAEQPDQAAVDAKIDELLEAKRAMLRAHYRHIAGQRAVLTPDQRVAFDLQTIHRAMHGKRHRGGGHH